jgi:predicted alpha/beta hydrolase family esterase
VTTTRIVLLDGWQHRRAPVHWQGWLAERLVACGWDVDYVTLPDPAHPRYEAWSTVVQRVVSRGEAPIVVAHGLSVLLWLRMCEDESVRMPVIPRGILVAPPASGAHGGDVSEYRPSPLLSAGVRRRHSETPLLVSADDDPYFPGGAADLVAQAGVDWVRLATGAHLNTASGHGPWPEALSWCLSGAWPTPAPDPEEETAMPAIASDDLDTWLSEVYRPAGHRLGILSAGLPDNDAARVDRVIRAGGLVPPRRHARVQPRPGEAKVRPADLADFVRRYGHEYQAALVDSALLEGPGGDELLAALQAEKVPSRTIAV